MDPGIIETDPHGDLLLHVRHRDCIDQLYRVSTSALRSRSAYFDSLLDSTKFSEGRAIHERLNEVLSRFSNDITTVPVLELPQVTISDIGQVPREKNSESAFRRFLDILHNTSTNLAVPGLQSLAVLVVIADRFHAVKPGAQHLSCQAWLRDSIEKSRHFGSSVLGEMGLRQTILISFIIRYSPWIYHYSAILVREGSERWTSNCVDIAEEYPWWHLPYGIEEELFHRRNCILNTIGSLQSHFLQLYISKKLQCKLGYDTSPQCDSFQLGEMVRFAVRRGTMKVENTFTDVSDSVPYAGNLDGLIQLLRQIPPYQVDKHHVHCGPRTRLEPILSSLASFSHIGICLRCWERGREDSWLDNPVGGHWDYKTATMRKVDGQCRSHQAIKAMYTADKRDWTPPL